MKQTFPQPTVRAVPFFLVLRCPFLLPSFFVAYVGSSSDGLKSIHEELGASDAMPTGGAGEMMMRLRW